MAQSIDRIRKDVSLSDSLIRRAAEGDEAAFAALAAHFQPHLSRMIAAFPIPEEEKGDLRQEGLIGLYKAVLLYDETISSFSTFASVCMRSGVLEGLRKYNRLHASASLDIEAEEIPSGDNASPERILLGKEELSTLLSKVDDVLSPLERRVFGLHLQGKTVSEIAALIEKKPKSVENTLFRLRKKLSALS